MVVTSADAVALTILALSAIWGLVRGFVTEALSLGAWIGAIVCAFWFYPLTLPYITPHLPDHPVAVGVGFAVVFVLALILLSMIANAVGQGLRVVLAGGPDRLLGAVFGIARGYMVLVVLFIALHLVSHGWLDGLMSGSQLGPYIARGAAWLQASAGGWIPTSINAPPLWSSGIWSHG